MQMIRLPGARGFSRAVGLLATVAALTLAGAAEQSPQSGPHYTQVYALNPREGVFAYARVAPDGRRLVYASQLPARPGVPRMWTETLVDLATKEVILNEPGIDAYWSLDGTRIIYSGDGGVTV